MRKRIWIIICLILLFLVVLCACQEEKTVLHFEAEYYLAPGEELQLDNRSRRDIQWTSSNEAVATVSDSGMVTAVNAGIATITAQIDRQVYSAEIEVPKITVPQNGQNQELLYKCVDGEELSITFMAPTRQVYDRAPVVLLIFGGGWQRGYPEQIINYMKTAVSGLRDRGFAVAAADYRLISNSDRNVKTCVADLMDAAHYLAHFADILQIDANKIVPMGHSAGANLAMLVANAPKDAFQTVGFSDPYEVLCCCGFGTVMFLYKQDLFEEVNRNYASLIDGMYSDEDARLCSPYTHIGPDNVPTLLIHGDKDELVNVQQAILSEEKAKSTGADLEFLLCKNGNHLLDHGSEPSLKEAMLYAVDWICRKMASN